MRLALIYGSTLGRTARAASLLREELGAGRVHRFGSVSSLGPDALRDCDVVLLGCSTWYVGDLQDDWAAALDELCGLDITGVRVGLFGMGDQLGFPDTYCNALGRLRELLAERGAVLDLGLGSAEGYAFRSSAAQLPDGRLCGLALDDDNQAGLTPVRVRRWARQVLFELGLPAPVKPLAPRRIMPRRVLLDEPRPAMTGRLGPRRRPVRKAG